MQGVSAAKAAETQGKRQRLSREGQVETQGKRQRLSRKGSGNARQRQCSASPVLRIDLAVRPDERAVVRLDIVLVPDCNPGGSVRGY